MSRSGLHRCSLAVAVALVCGGSGLAHAELSAPAAGAAVTTGATVVRAASAVPEREPAPPLRLVSSKQLGPRLTELEFVTPYLEGPTRVRVLTPVGYADDARRRWPLLLLLHGTSETPPGSEPTGYAGWTENGDAEAITRPGKFLVVMPEARAGFYTDHYGVAGEGGPAWESYHLRQLLPWMDAHYRTITTRAGRAVAGLSMGGGGALNYAARHPDVFSFAESYSGAVDATDPEQTLPVRSPVRATDINQALQPLDGRPPASAFGPWVTEEIRTRKHYSLDLVGNLRHTVLTLRTGDGRNDQGVIVDPLEFAVHGQNVNLHAALNRAGIRHTYDDYGPGGHTWVEFARGLRQLVGPLNEHFASAPARAPRAFSFRAAEERIDVYGYRLKSDRGFLEFASLDIGPARISLSGSGAFHVTTPPDYTPAKRYRLTASRNGVVEHVVTEADREGRLSFVVDTLRRSSGQQYRQSSTTAVNQVRVDVRPS